MVGAKSYFAKRSPPKTPQDLMAHSCINLRFRTHGGLWAWDFERDGRELKVRVDGRVMMGKCEVLLDPRSVASASSRRIHDGATHMFLVRTALPSTTERGPYPKVLSSVVPASIPFRRADLGISAGY